MATNVITGAKAKIRINGTVVGYATGISITETTLNGRVESLGYIDSREITPISRTVTGTCSLIRIFNQYTSDVAAVQPVGRSVAYTDNIGEGGKMTDDILFTNTQVSDAATSFNGNFTLKDRTSDVLNKKAFVIEIVDSATGDSGNDAPQVIYSVHGCRVSSQNVVVDRGSLMGVQVTFDAEYLVRYDGVDSLG